MHHSFTDTMVNLTWTDLEESADKNAIVLMPLGVIEEHGPHLCLGTDIYTATIYCHFVKEKLEQKGIDAVIAPPFYWGICQSTGSFIGSFKIRKETARNLLFDIVSSLCDFGFKQVFGINAHGDIEQHITILEAFKEANEKLSIRASYVFQKSLFPHYGLCGDEGYICPIDPQSICVSTSAAPDVHAGDIETATMHAFYPDFVNVELAKKLKAVKVGEAEIIKWLFGGFTKELSPNGYLGDPGNYEKVDVMENVRDYVDRISNGILDKFQSSI